jgi:hypothetical protein
MQIQVLPSGARAICFLLTLPRKDIAPAKGNKGDYGAPLPGLSFFLSHLPFPCPWLCYNPARGGSGGQPFQYPFGFNAPGDHLMLCAGGRPPGEKRDPGLL